MQKVQVSSVNRISCANDERIDVYTDVFEVVGSVKLNAL